MLFAIRTLFLGLICTMWLSSAVAAPPADCVKKHAGRWQITVRATGQTYPADLFPNGTGVSHCPGCAPGTWTCSGNTSTVFVNGITIVSTLSADGMQSTSGCCTAMRLGGRPAAVAARSEPAGQPPRNNSGSSLSPGSQFPDTTDVKRAAAPQKPPITSVHLGNKPIEDTGVHSVNPNEKTRNSFGLSESTKRQLDALRHSPEKRKRYLATLSREERVRAEKYIASTQTATVPGATKKKTGSADGADCAGMWERLKPHAPDDKWIVDQMARSSCHPDGTPYTLRERTKQA